MKLTAPLLFLTAALGGCASISVRGPVEVDARTYVLPPAHVGQSFGAGLSAKAEPEVSVQSEDGKHTAVVQPFLRFDTVDQNRSHFDIRQADYTYTNGGFLAGLGVGIFNWGTLDVMSLNNIINQIDFVEDVDQRTKLGQPYTRMKYTLSPESLVGRSFALEALLLPVSRPRTFPGQAGRLRPPTLIDPVSEFDSPLGAFHPTVAVRGTYAGPYVNIGFSTFSGTSRDPTFVAQLTTPKILTRYDLLQQAGVDASLTLGDVILKTEAVGRLYGRRLIPSWAVAFGAEYTWYETFGLPWDLTLLGEYGFDSRPKGTPKTAFQNDVFTGGRLAFNDDQSTALTLGTTVDVQILTDFDLQNYGGVLRLGAERRITDNWKVSADAHVFVAGPKTLQWWLAKDSYARVGLAYYF